MRDIDLWDVSSRLRQSPSPKQPLPGDPQGTITVLIYCPACDERPHSAPERRFSSETRFPATSDQLTVLRSIVGPMKCYGCRGPMDLRAYPPLRLVEASEDL